MTPIKYLLVVLLFVGAVAACNSTVDCYSNGVCDPQANVCVCNSGYTTSNCSYKQKKQLTAFLLQLFLGKFGAGHFYLGNINLAVGQLVLSLSTCILPCILMLLIKCMMDNNSDNSCGVMTAGVAQCLTAIITLAIIGWWIAELILIGTGTRTDGNGMPMEYNM